MPALPLNDQNLPYPDPLHPIIVHFVIAMVFFSFLCDVMGYLTRKHHLIEVSFWNMFAASICIFLAVIFGQFEAGLAQSFGVAQAVLSMHTVTDWSLSAIVVGIARVRSSQYRRSLAPAGSKPQVGASVTQTLGR